MAIKGLKGLIGFLTIIPFGMEPFEIISKYFFLSPLVGLIIGAIGGALGLVSSAFLPQLITGFIILTAIELLTGLHHFDGLMDFSDAVMVKGDAAKRLEIMHDKFTGAAAVSTGVFVLVITGLSYGHFGGIEILKLAIVSEIMAKQSMVLTAYFGRIPPYEGTGKHIVESLKNKPMKLLFSIAISALVIFLLVQDISLVWVFVAMAIAATTLSAYANKSLGCVTGDVLGATNEINRMISLLVLVATMT